MIAETFLALLTAHLVADFLAQTDWMVANKKRLDVLLLHVFIVTAVTALLIGTANWPLLGITFLSHLLIDAIKMRVSRDGLLAFALDQIAHILVALALAITFPVDFDRSAILGLVDADDRPYYFVTLALAAGLIAAIEFGAVLVRKFIARYASEITEDSTGIKGAGALIGRLERALIILLIIGGEPDGIGFLVAAKSILRFGEISQAKDRKISEYIIIGTFVSFAWGIACGLLMSKGVGYWLPPVALSPN